METPTFRTKPMQVMEARLGEPLEDVIRRLYNDQGMTLAEVATELGVTTGTISRWMAALGIEARFPGQKGQQAPAVPA